MATFELPSTQATGTLITSTMYAALGSWRRPPMAKAHRDAVQNIPTGTWTAVEFDVEEWDTDGIWSSTASERFNINTAGKYRCEFSAGVGGSSLGTFRGVQIQVDSTADTAANPGVRNIIAAEIGPNSFALSVADTFALTSTQFISCLIIQNTGSNLATSTAANVRPRVSVMWQST